MPEANILVLESEGVVCWDLEDCLSRVGYQVSAAMTGEEALAHAIRQPPEIGLIDTGLRGGRNGAEIARELQERHGTLIVFLTTCFNQEARIRFGALKPVAFFPKPFAERDLLNVVERTITIRMSSRRHANCACPLGS